MCRNSQGRRWGQSKQARLYSFWYSFRTLIYHLTKEGHCFLPLQILCWFGDTLSPPAFKMPHVQKMVITGLLCICALSRGNFPNCGKSSKAWVWWRVYEQWFEGGMKTIYQYTSHVAFDPLNCSQKRCF